MAIFSEKTKKSTKKSEVVVRHMRTTTSVHGAAHDVLRAPWFSEKALLMTEKGVYAFAVNSRATSAQIAGAVKEIYNVTPKAVHIVNLPAKKKSLRTRRGVGVRAARRKAYVYLNAGDSIQFA